MTPSSRKPGGSDSPLIMHTARIIGGLLARLVKPLYPDKSSPAHGKLPGAGLPLAAMIVLAVAFAVVIWWRTLRSGREW